MADTAVNILQSIRNKVDTCETGWTTFASSITPIYNDAFTTHKNTLSGIKQAIQLEAEQGWAAFNMALSLVGGFWVPRLLKPLKGTYDELVGEWVNDTLTDGVKHGVTEGAKEAQKNISGTVMEKLKNVAVKRTGDPYEPVVESTIDWGARLNEGITKRSFVLKNSLDPLIRNADRWSVRAAEFMEQSFSNYCPFIVDMPLDSSGETSPKFKTEFRKLAELTMWRNWGLARNEKWWKDNPNHSDIFKMGPLFDRLMILDVAPHDVANYMGWTGYTRRPGWRFDMVKFIEWSKKVSLKDVTGIAKKIAAPDQCRIPADNKLFLKPKLNPHVCYVGGIP